MIARMGSNSGYNFSMSAKAAYLMRKGSNSQSRLCYCVHSFCTDCDEPTESFMKIQRPQYKQQKNIPNGLRCSLSPRSSNGKNRSIMSKRMLRCTNNLSSTPLLIFVIIACSSYLQCLAFQSISMHLLNRPFLWSPTLSKPQSYCDLNSCYQRLEKTWCAMKKNGARCSSTSNTSLGMKTTEEQLQKSKETAQATQILGVNLPTSSSDGEMKSELQRRIRNDIPLDEYRYSKPSCDPLTGYSQSIQQFKHRINHQTLQKVLSTSSSNHRGKNPNYDIEKSIRKFGQSGKTNKALEWYFAVWSIDEIRDLLNAETKNNSNDAGMISIESLTPELRKLILESKIRPTTRLMNLAIDACARANPPRQEMAFELFCDATGDDIFYFTKDFTIRMADRGEGSSKRRSRPTLSPNVFTFGSLLAACARNGDIASSLRILHVLEEGKTYPDVVPNGVIYSTVISCCERTDPPRSDLALELLNNATMNALASSSQGDKGNIGNRIKGGIGVIGFNAAISAMARAAQWKTAVRLLDEMILHSSSPSTLPSTGQSPQTTNFSNFFPISLSQSTPSLQPLLHVLQNDDVDIPCSSIIPKPDQVTFGTVLAACERANEWRELLRIAKASREYGVDLDGIALTSALHACQQLGLAEEALEYLELMKRLDKGGGEDDERTGARTRIGAKMPLRGPDAVAYRLAISACARSPGGVRWRDGINLLDEMRKASNSNNAEGPDVVAYTAAIAGCSEAGEYVQAMRLIQTMKNEGIKPNVVTFSAVINACASASAALARRREEEDRSIDLADIKVPMERALRLLSAMKSPTSTVQPNIVTYNAAIRACAEGFNVDGAFDLLEQIKDDGLEPTVITYGTLMTACERVGNVEGASKVFRMVKQDDNIQANEIIYGAAISCCRKAGEPERALLLLRKMMAENLSPNTATFNTVIAALSEANNASKSSIKSSDTKTTPSNNLWEKALAVYKAMKSKHAPSGVAPNRQTYNILIRNLCANLQPNYAESLLNTMLKDGYVPDVDLYTMTVRAYEKCGNLMKAVSLMESMREVGYDFYDIEVLNNAFKNAVKIVNRMGKGISGSEQRKDVFLSEDVIDDEYDDEESFNLLI